MATIKNQVNPINIAPFVDILLVLFVILVVVARFDGISKADEYINANKELREKIKTLKANAALFTKKFKIQNQKKIESSNLLKESNQKLLKKLESLKKKNSLLLLNQKDTKQFLKLKESNQKLEKRLKAIKNMLKNVKKDLLAYKDDPKRKDDLHISIDREGKIWLIDAITRKQLLEITFQNYKDILSSLTFANVKYFFFKDSQKAMQTVKKIKNNNF